MDATKYRSVEETYPFFDVTFSNDEPGCLSAFEVAAYCGNGTGGSKITFSGTGNTIQLKDPLIDFEKRLFDCLAVNILGDVEEIAEVKVDDPISDRTDKDPRSNQPTKKK